MNILHQRENPANEGKCAKTMNDNAGDDKKESD
jgi:hypothetical protein